MAAREGEGRREKDAASCGGGNSCVLPKPVIKGRMDAKDLLNIPEFDNATRGFSERLRGSKTPPNLLS